MRVLEVREKYAGRRFIIKKGDFEPVDTELKNIVYKGKLDTEKYDTCTVTRYYVLDQLPIKTVVIYTPDVTQELRKG